MSQQFNVVSKREHPWEDPNTSLVVYSKITPSAVPIVVDKAINDYKQSITELLRTTKVFTWENLILFLDSWEEYLHRIVNPITHLASCDSSSELRDVTDDMNLKLVNLTAWIDSHCGLYSAIKSLPICLMTKSQKRHWDNLIQNFKDGGIALDEEDQELLAQVNQCLASYGLKYSNNIVDSTDDFAYHITDKQDLAGTSNRVLEIASQKASNRGLEGYILTLDQSTVSDVLRTCDNRKVRYDIHKAYMSIASEISNDGKYDNSDIIEEILCLRMAKATLLGYSSHSELSLVDKMATDEDAVMTFLEEFNFAIMDKVNEEASDMIEYASRIGINDFQPHDKSYVAHKMKKAIHDIDSEMIREYFPLERVLQNGLFNIVNKLFNVHLVEIPHGQVDIWHPSVRAFNLLDSDNNIKAMVYMDLFSRKHKRGGAWMSDAFNPIKTHNDIKPHIPVAYMICNFTPPTSTHDSLLTQNDIETLFHEFGHCLHLMLTEETSAGLCGINGVPWDAVELPSQFLENWCWVPEVLRDMSSHYKTEEQLDYKIIQKMIDAKNFYIASHYARQIEYSLFDMVLHSGHELDPKATLQEIRSNVSAFQYADYDRFECSFSHIFSGGYSSGYYSYAWAEVLSADAFGAFQENGIYDADTAKAYHKHILSVGGSVDINEAFELFRGRPASIDALLVQRGIKAA